MYPVNPQNVMKFLEELQAANYTDKLGILERYLDLASQVNTPLDIKRQWLSLILENLPPTSSFHQVRYKVLLNKIKAMGLELSKQEQEEQREKEIEEKEKNRQERIKIADLKDAHLTEQQKEIRRIAKIMAEKDALENSLRRMREEESQYCMQELKNDLDESGVSGWRGREYWLEEHGRALQGDAYDPEGDYYKEQLRQKAGFKSYLNDFPVTPQWKRYQNHFKSYASREFLDRRAAIEAMERQLATGNYGEESAQNASLDELNELARWAGVDPIIPKNQQNQQNSFNPNPPHQGRKIRR